MIDNSTIERLTVQAQAVRLMAYAPYSSFQVGAVLLTADGRVFSGCNVENISFGLTICAERNALAAAVTAGYREFSCLLVLSDSATPVAPCGACRQVLAEFGSDLQVVSINLGGDSIVQSLADLLPDHDRGILG